MTIGESIKKRRKELGLTLEDLAKRVDSTRATISRYETGYITNIPLDRVEALAEALFTSPAYLMGWEEKKEKALQLEELFQDDPQLKTMCDMLKKLSLDDMKEAENYLNYLLSQKISREKK